MVNPARAGMIPLTSQKGASPTSKPRASGDDPNGHDQGIYDSL